MMRVNWSPIWAILAGFSVVGLAAAGVWAVFHSPPDAIIESSPVHLPTSSQYWASIATAEDTETSLAESERIYLWEIEHHGNILNAYGFKLVADALRNADTDALIKLFHADFAGELPRMPREVATHSEVVTVVRREDDGQPPIQVGRQKFIERLMDYRRVFTGAPPKVQLVLKTVSPKRKREMDGPWTGTAQLRLHGESSPGQPCEVVLILSYEVPRPSKETFSEPGWFRGCGEKQSLVARADRYLLPDTTRAHGLDPSRLHDNWLQNPNWPSSRMIATGGVFVCDFNRDGILDVLITDVNGYFLYRGGPDGRFVDVTAEVGLPTRADKTGPIGAVACWVDIDGDGWEDLILGRRVYRNMEGKRFEDYTSKTSLRLPVDTVSLAVADYDRDGKLDIYATRTGRGTEQSWLNGRSGPDAGNLLYRNLGNWQFQNVTAEAGAEGGNRSTFSAVWLDANNDGWPDLHVINEFGNGVLLINRGDGTFAEHSLGEGPVDFGSMGVAAGDIDNDGNIDIYCANMYSKAGRRVIGNMPPKTYSDEIMAKLRRFVAGSELHLNKGNLRFEHVGEKMQVNGIGWSYGPVLADLDNDGWLDLYCTGGQISRDRDKPDG